MMNRPYIDELSEKGESRYTLIAVASRRARKITEENPELSRSGSLNPVSRALHELNDDKLLWHHRDPNAEPIEPIAAAMPEPEEEFIDFNAEDEDDDEFNDLDDLDEIEDLDEFIGLKDNRADEE